MVDRFRMDPDRVERLRDPERLAYLDPERVWEVVDPIEAGVIVDIGTGVGFLALPFARRFPRSIVYACDILDGMLALLGESVAAEGLVNVRPLRMEPSRVPLPDAGTDLVAMAQVHHELDDAPALLEECRRLLVPKGRLVIIDWKDEENPVCPTAGRRVPEPVLIRQMEEAGFVSIESHDTYAYHNFLTGFAG